MIRTFYLKDVSDGRNYRPTFMLVQCDELRTVVAPKIGDVLGMADIEAMVCNGNRVVLDPGDRNHMLRLPVVSV